jgi:hypothetical protein
MNTPGVSLSQSRFINRQSLYLRPDPARVVVRPFKPATEPRDLNATDKVRANHIVGRVLRLEAEAAAHQLSDVLENFEGRHRNLLNIFETRAEEMEDAFEPHAELNQTQRRLIGAYFLMSTPSRRRPCSTRASFGIPTSPVRRRMAAASS